MDRVAVVVQPHEESTKITNTKEKFTSSSSGKISKDEIQDFFDCRYETVLLLSSYI